MGHELSEDWGRACLVAWTSWWWGVVHRMTSKRQPPPKVAPVPEGDRLNLTDVARLLGVHRNTVRNRIRQGVYPSAGGKPAPACGTA